VGLGTQAEGEGARFAIILGKERARNQRSSEVVVVAERSRGAWFANTTNHTRETNDGTFEKFDTVGF